MQRMTIKGVYMIYNVPTGGYRVLYFDATKAFVVGEHYTIDGQRLIATNVTKNYLRGRVL